MEIREQPNFLKSRELKMNSKMEILEMDNSMLAGCW